ncbi:MAG: hypothetical protein ACR2PO_04255, partial [Methyloligellaceae bacterium]
MSTKLMEPVTGPEAWSGRALQDDTSWIHVLSDDEIAEIEAALQGLDLSGLREPRFDRDEFPLPGLGPRLAEVLEQVQNGRGFALVRGL